MEENGTHKKGLASGDASGMSATRQAGENEKAWQFKVNHLRLIVFLVWIWLANSSIRWFNTFAN